MGVCHLPEVPTERVHGQGSTEICIQKQLFKIYQWLWVSVIKALLSQHTRPRYVSHCRASDAQTRQSLRRLHTQSMDVDKDSDSKSDI